MKQQADFTQGGIAGPLIRFALPVLLAMCLQSLYGAVDLLIVGRFGQAADVSAVAIGSHMMQMVTMLFTGMSMGTTVLLGQMIGSGKRESAGNVIGSSICFFAGLTAVVMVAAFLASRSLVGLMQTPAEAFDGTLTYLRICVGGVVFIVAYNLLGSIFRGMGDSATPLFTVAIACVFNIFGDLVLVAGLHMQAAGAAIATVGAQAISVLISLALIRKRGLPFPFGKENMYPQKILIIKMAKLGAPIALQDCLVSLSFLMINAFVNSLGLIFSAGVGVAEKVCAFIMLVPSSFSQSLSAFVAQNAGAGKFDRAAKSMACGMGLSIAAGVILAYASFFHGDLFTGLFSTEPDVVVAAHDYLKAYAIDTLLVSFLFCFLGYFNGCGKTTFVMAQGLVGAFCVRVPVSFFMSRSANPTLFRIGLATPSSTVVQITMCVIYFLIMRKRLMGRGKGVKNG